MIVQPIFYDFEFDENGSTIVPISLGMTKLNSDEELYIEFEFDEKKIQRENKWVWQNVVPLLSWPKRMRMNRLQAKAQVLNFTGGNPRTAPCLELWAFYADYDHVALAQLFGKMIDMPPNFPKYTLDLQQEFWRLGSPSGVKPEKSTDEHNALADARWNKQFYLNMEDHRNRYVRKVL